MYSDENRRALQGLGFLEDRTPTYHIHPITRVPPLVLGYSLYDHVEKGNRESTTSIMRLKSEPGRPGLIFALNQNTLRQLLSELEIESVITVVRSVDIDGIAYSYQGNALNLLQRYYVQR